MSVPDKTSDPSRTCSKEGCGRAGKLTRGMCTKCYRYWLDHTPKEERPAPPRAVDDFWQQVERTHEWGCWLWHGPSNHQGYGLWKNRHLAHREAWKRERGPIGPGLLALHICDQKPCVNPRHLYLGTHVENGIDASVRGHLPDNRKQYCPKGHAKEGDNLLTVRSKGRLERRCRQCETKRKVDARRAARWARGLKITRLSPEEEDRVRGLLADGVSQRKVAAAVGRSLSAVRRVAATTEAPSDGDR